VWAPVLGLEFSSTALHLPHLATQSLAIIGTAADGAALVLTGLVVSAQAFEFDGSTLVVLLLKCAVQPGLALAISRLMQLPIEQVRYITLIAAIPCGFFGLVFGERFGSNPKLASAGLIVSYAASIATLALWIAFINRLT